MADFPDHRRGKCGACGHWGAVTTKGVMRKHDSSTPLRREADYGRGHWGICAGTGLPPIDAEDRPLPERVAELERENARLRSYAQALEHDRNAWKLRVDSLGHIHKANRALLDALRAMMDGDSGDEHAERFEADMARIRAEFPDVYDGRRK